VEQSTSSHLAKLVDFDSIAARVDAASLVLFDLDDTLYFEMQYLKACYLAISRDASAKSGVPTEDIFGWLQSEFQETGRGQIFQKLCRVFAISPHQIGDWVHIMRTVNIPEGLSLKIWAEPILDRCRGKAAILTNGNSEQQENKVKLLGLRNAFPEIPVYCAEQWEPKPSTAVLGAIEEDFSFVTNDALMIGDSSVDEEFASLAKIEFLHVKVIDDAFA